MTDLLRYKIDAMFDSGSFGVVFRAVDSLTGETVALKKLKPFEVVGDAHYRRFIHEIKIIESVQHRNIVPILYSDIWANPPFYIMPFYEYTLATVVREAPIELPLIRKVMGDLLAGVSFLHAHAIAHRDLHPSNVLYNGREFVISDFGISKQINADTARTYSDLGGIRGYAAPEQFELDRKVDTRADIFALGGILIYCLTGEAPISVTRDRIPPIFQPVIDRCRQEFAGERFQGIGELRDALERVFDEQYAWDARREIQSVVDGTFTAPITPETLNVLILSIQHDPGLGVQFLDRLSDTEISVLISFGGFVQIIHMLETHLTHRDIHIPLLSLFGRVLVRIGVATSSLELSSACGLALARLGYVHDVSSFRQYFHALWDSLAERSDHAQFLDSILEGFPGERRWLIDMIDNNVEVS